MPRTKGSKNKTIDEQMQQLTEDIEALRAQIAEKEAELTRLKNLRDQEAMKTLMEAMAKSGKSVSDVLEMIRKEEGLG